MVTQVVTCHCWIFIYCSQHSFYSFINFSQKCLQIQSVEVSTFFWEACLRSLVWVYFACIMYFTHYASKPNTVSIPHFKFFLAIIMVMLMKYEGSNLKPKPAVHPLDSFLDQCLNGLTPTYTDYSQKFNYVWFN